MLFRFAVSINLQLLYHVTKFRLYPFNPSLLPHRDESTFVELYFCWFLNFHLFPHHSVGILRKVQFLNYPPPWASMLPAMTVSVYSPLHVLLESHLSWFCWAICSFPPTSRKDCREYHTYHTCQFEHNTHNLSNISIINWASYLELTCWDWARIVIVYHGDEGNLHW